MSFVVGAIKNEKMDELVFLVEASIVTGVYTVKLWILIWKQNQILHLLKRICEFSIRDDCGYVLFKDKLGGFIKFVVGFVTGLIIALSLETVVFPMFGTEKTLFYKIWFPLDWRNSEVAFWMANIFIFIGDFIMMTVMLFSIIIWYLLLNCALRYEVLGSEIRDMGHITEKGNKKLSEMQMHNNFFESLKESIDAHVHLKEYISSHSP